MLIYSDQINRITGHSYLLMHYDNFVLWESDKLFSGKIQPSGNTPCLQLGMGRLESQWYFGSLPLSFQESDWITRQIRQQSPSYTLYLLRFITLLTRCLYSALLRYLHVVSTPLYYATYTLYLLRFITLLTRCLYSALLRYLHFVSTPRYYATYTLSLLRFITLITLCLYSTLLRYLPVA